MNEKNVKHEPAPEIAALQKKYAPTSTNVARELKAILGKDGIQWNESAPYKMLGLSEGAEIGVFIVIYLLAYVFLHGFKSLLPHKKEENIESEEPEVII